MIKNTESRRQRTLAKPLGNYYSVITGTSLTSCCCCLWYPVDGMELISDVNMRLQLENQIDRDVGIEEKLHPISRHYCRYGRVTNTLQVDITTQAAILNRGAPDDGGYYAYILVIDYEYPIECFVQRISIIGSITDALHNLKTILAIGKKGDDPKFHCNVCFQMKAFLEHEFRTNLKTDFEKKIENLS